MVPHNIQIATEITLNDFKLLCFDSVPAWTYTLSAMFFTICMAHVLLWCNTLLTDDTLRPVKNVVNFMFLALLQEDIPIFMGSQLNWSAYTWSSLIVVSSLYQLNFSECN
jgi:hypothetical protein